MRTKRTRKTTNKQGISLIVLVITIIVMTILTGAIVLTLNSSGIIDRATEAVEKTNEASVMELAQMAWAEAYLNTDKSQEKIEEYVLDRLTKANIDIDEYAITVTTNGVSVVKSVVAIVDTVPIPKGFVASQATGENTKNGGLVIYEGTEPVTNANVEEAKRTRNQYVWVPVEDFSKFVRQDFLNSSNVVDTNGNYNALGTKNVFWEVIVDSNNMPLPTQNSAYMTERTIEEVQAMYESVKEYKGFYIARYEAGIDEQRTSNTTLVKGSKVYSQMGKIPYTYIPWTKNDVMNEDTNGAVEVARSIYPETNLNYGVVSTLTYGVQWDRTLAWWLEVKAKDGKGNEITSIDNSTSYGNYEDHLIAAGDLNYGAKYASYSTWSNSLTSYELATTATTKESVAQWALTTGALKVASVNNIWDMAGNMWELTMEGYSTNYRVRRGGSFGLGNGVPVSYRNIGYNPDYENNSSGFRPSLYIKK